MKYEIKGSPFPVAMCYLSEGEQIITEGGGMSWMSPNMEMKTTTNGGIGKALGRMLSADKMFQNRYTSIGGNGMIAFTSCCPGEIKAIELRQGDELICQKSSFLASTSGVEMSTVFRKKLGAGLFGGEGFIMQKFTGEGILFIEIDGTPVEYNLAAGEKIILDTGHLVMMEGTCKMDIQTVKGAKNIFFGGEGLFNTVVEGPGKVIIQTMPINKLADSISRYIPTSSN
ncbi:MAG: TIGR00266 family protein [Acetobacter sp.]|nr:TIGR00266 family protein [Bacteroides sp.]MCM1341839.1 TIGR00266 family protein [Acetobacter sp.]MCM1434005.1 TIGR00266 family protein [Clostridiales bacterium]